MSTGDADDIAARLRRYMPRWFGRTTDPTPVLDAVLYGLGGGLATIWDLLAFTRKQARLATMDGGWLDLAALDFFGPDGFRRFLGEGEASYRTRLRQEPFRKRNTRDAIRDAVLDITGAPPVEIFEGWDVPTCGGYGAGAALAYGVAGRYGSDGAPAEVIISLPEPQGYGIPNTPGWGSGFFGYGAAGSNFRYVDASEITGAGPTKGDIIRAIDAVRPAGIRFFIRFLAPLGT